ncbi:DUF4307 domain-containing protein [Nocardioides sp.]|uniref:DUF4307 domain-containing protein n=1 Tax=Nocardioides sp. TaxID=35761 RepID=UPI002733FBAB|nr:DUF4307 domain-containing protein [Nocardioides sp.]MDP3892648.1 DUF4307 domain-containing protein [Nocardioides sp.]
MTTRDLLDQRYGRSRPLLRVVLIVAATTLAAAFGGWLAWTAWFHGTPDARSTLVGYEVTGPHEVVARVDVRLKDDSVEASCKLRAIAEDHTVVGELNFTLPSDDFDEAGTVRRAIRTQRTATAVEMVGCTTADQPRPR